MINLESRIAAFVVKIADEIAESSNHYLSYDDTYKVCLAAAKELRPLFELLGHYNALRYDHPSADDYQIQIEKILEGK